MPTRTSLTRQDLRTKIIKTVNVTVFYHNKKKCDKVHFPHLAENPVASPGHPVSLLKPQTRFIISWVNPASVLSAPSRGILRLWEVPATCPHVWEPLTRPRKDPRPLHTPGERKLLSEMPTAELRVS